MRRLLSGVVDFLVGDDLRVSAGVLITLGAAGAAARAGLDPWWLVVVAVPVVVAWSLRRAVREPPP